MQAILNGVLKSALSNYEYIIIIELKCFKMCFGFL